VLVHEDRKAPVVGVAMWYNVGSKDEPKGKTGFAHLFEHLMFNGSENLPGDYFEYLQQIGATDYNGTTNGSTAPTISRRCRPARSSGRCSWKATAWAICSARSPRRSSITSAASSRTRSARATTSPAAWSSTRFSRTCSPTATPTALDDRLDGRPRRGEPRRRAGLVPRQIRPNNAVLVLAGDIDAADRPAAGREIFRSHPARPGQQSGAGRRADACRAQVDGDEGSRRRGDGVALLADAGLLDRKLVALDVGGSVLGGLASSRLDRYWCATKSSPCR
jgi:zinc protease